MLSSASARSVARTREAKRKPVAKSRAKKDHHWVPQCYQKAWLDEASKGQEKLDPYCWYFPVDGGPPFRRAPENMFSEKDLYTIKAADGGRDLRLEDGLAGLEKLFADVRRKKLDRRVALAAEDRLVLGVFAAAMYHRTPRKRDHEKEQWGKVFEMGETLRKCAQTATREQLRRASSPSGKSGEPISPEFVEAMAKAPLQTALWPRLGAHGRILARMDLAVLCTRAPAFVTSDDPCVWWDPGAWKKPFQRGPDLAHPEIQVSLPVSPSQCLLFNRAGCNGYGLATPEQVASTNEFRSDWAVEHLLFCGRELPHGATAGGRRK